MVKHEELVQTNSLTAAAPPAAGPSGSSPLPLIRSPNLSANTLTSAAADESKRKHAHWQKEQRTVPCADCRRVRRTCQWLEDGSGQCRRCRDKGIRCSGPVRRRRRPDNEVVAAAFALATGQTPEGPLSPTSSSARWTTLHLSYALCCHLVDSCKPVEAQLVFSRHSLSGISRDLNRARGRLEELAWDVEAILGAPDVAPAYTSLAAPTHVFLHDPVTVGQTRHAALSRIAALALARLASAPGASSGALPLADAVNRLLLTLMILDGLPNQFAEERREMYGRAVREGCALRREKGCVGETREQLEWVLSNMIRPDFDAPLPVLTNEQLAAICFDTSIGDLTPSFFLTWHDALCAYSETLHYTLAYAPLSRLPSAIRYCWKRHADLHDHLLEHLPRVLHHPQYIAEPAKYYRVANFADHVCKFYLEALRPLSGAYSALFRCNAPHSMVAEGRELVYTALSTATDLLDTAFSLHFEKVRSYWLAFPLTDAFEPFRRDLLPAWAAQDPHRGDRLLHHMRFASFFSSEAARLARDLEKVVTPVSPPHHALCTPASTHRTLSTPATSPRELESPDVAIK
ncbi:hypothetical protein Rhopal_007853-T1 [Rhodotorula paludigena]|uniref:Zn(2)-C6 fungal-type domain-containing protein n=1 Tax=Rhodotorula paludigena TaxID=86838 RepID=A0AAV5GQT1_9BASI|nr:hypothetical protein Rhopal_007853-T1 [Rhodotorula paludigena]